MLRTRPAPCAPVALALIAAAAAPAVAQLHTPLYTTLSGAPTSQVPGLPGAEFTAFRRPTRSPDGLKWALLADTTVGYVLLVDKNDGAGPQVVLQEGQPAPWTPDGSGEFVGQFTLADRNLAVLDDGRIAFTNSTTGGNSATNRYVVIYDGTTFTAAAQEGQPVPASAGLPDGTLFGSTLECPQVDTMGRIGFRASLSGPGIISAQDNALFFDGQVIAREGVTGPAGQLADPPETYIDFPNRAYYRSADGSTWMSYSRISGDLAQDRLAEVNGTVVAQEGLTLPGFDAPIGVPVSPFTGITEVAMMPGGDWFVRGANTDGVGWTMHNGEIIARTFEPITPGATEHWDPFLFTPTFVSAVSNDVGDYLICGTTDVFPVDGGGVVVLNGRHVVVRSFDPIDLDGDGMADDDFYIRQFFFDDLFLTNSGRLLIKVQARDLLDNAMGEVILDLDVSDLLTPACVCELDGDDAQVNVFDLLAYLDLWFPQNPAADIDGTPGVDVFDLLHFLDCWFPASAGSPCN